MSLFNLVERFEEMQQQVDDLEVQVYSLQDELAGCEQDDCPECEECDECEESE